MANEISKENFDINVFDRAQYNDPGCDEHEWMLCPYSLNWDGDNYSIADEMADYNLVLTAEEAEMLTLGWGPDLGGDMEESEDFWIDANSFKETYKNIPQTVQLWLDFVMSKL